MKSQLRRYMQPVSYTHLDVYKRQGVESTTKGYDTDAIYSAVNSFVTNYNSVMAAVDDVSDTTAVSYTHLIFHRKAVCISINIKDLKRRTREYKRGSCNGIIF